MVRLICGILRRDGADADERMLAAMLDAMNPNRKPEARALRMAWPLGLGVLELAPHGDAPLAMARVVATDSGLLAADARIYNRDEIPGAAPAGGDDAVVAAAIARWGERAPRRLHGDFAYAVFDAASGVLTLVRDHFGVRPLQYVHRRGQYLAFASLPQALLRTGLAERILDQEVMHHMHLEACAPGHRTFYRQVRAVRPGHLVRFAPGTSGDERRYWRIPSPPFISFDSDPRELASEVRRLIDQAVRRRLPTAGPVAGHLSGGLDSSSIAAFAARAVRAEGRSFYGYSQQEPPSDHGIAYIDEASYVAALAEQEPNIEIVPIPSPGFYQVLAAGLDPDTLNPVAPFDPEEAAIRHAAEVGAGVMFSGWGGDEFVSNNGRGAEIDLALAGRWGMLLRHVRRRAEIYGGTVPGILFNNIALRLLPMGWRETGMSLLRGRWPRRAGPGRLRFLPARRRTRVLREHRPDGPGSQRARRVYGGAWWLPHKLELFAQQAAPHGIAFAFPLLDLDLVEYTLRIPGIFLRRDGGYRTLMRDSTKGVLPDKIRLRIEKLMPYPLESLRMAEGRDALLARLEAAEKIDLVREFVDIAAVGEFVEGLAGPEEVAAMIDRAVASGVQLGLADYDHENALVLISFLAEHAPILKTADAADG